MASPTDPDRPGWWTRPVEERRDYNAVEQAMIQRGDRAGAKVAWHKRTGK